MKQYFLNKRQNQENKKIIMLQNGYQSLESLRRLQRETKLEHYIALVLNKCFLGHIGYYMFTKLLCHQFIHL